MVESLFRLPRVPKAWCSILNLANSDPVLQWFISDLIARFEVYTEGIGRVGS